MVMADDSTYGRATGTIGERKAAAYIAKRFKQIGLQPKGGEGYFQVFTFVPREEAFEKIGYIVDSKNGNITGRNIVGYIDNKAPQTVVIGAHYDHLGYGGKNSLYKGEPAIHNGADDNASGVTVLLDLAKKLQKKKSRNNYMFIAFSGEELGLLGSNYFVKNPSVPLGTITYMLNMDMVGRLSPEKTLIINGTGTYPGWEKVLTEQNEHFKLVFKPSGVGPSDHTSFYLNDIPALHFFTGQHEDYHKPSDDADKLNFEGIGLVSGYIFKIIEALEKEGKLAFTKTKNESENVPKFKVTMGVVPDYGFTGEGMRIDGVSEGKPAQRAGLQKGDVVLQIGEHPVKDMMSYMEALSRFEKGQPTTVTINRAGEKLLLPLTF